MLDRPPGGDRRWLAILAAFMALGLAVSWLRWADPVIDSGREMSQPLRLLTGETLYSDVGHIYGPLTPYLHAGLYRMFGPSLAPLYVDGAVSALAIILLVYFLGRRLMPADAAGAAALTVVWLCTFKPAGNYIFPYAFSALHGTLLALAALTIAARALDAPSRSRFAWAGALAGVALLAKTEMGIPALVACVTAAWLSAPGDARRGAVRALIAGGVAVAVAGAVYTMVAARVGWHTLAVDSWLLPVNLPAPLAHYNAGLSGFDHPLLSLGRMLVAAVKLALLGAIVCAASYVAAGPRALASRARWMLAGALAATLILGLTTKLDWDRGPFLAMPILLAAILVRSARRPASNPDRLVVLYAVFALAQLARTILHVRSGGAYGSFLLPVSVVLFTWVWVGPFADALPHEGARRAARRIVLSLLILSAIGTAAVLTVRYRRESTVTVSTPRGTLVTRRDVGVAWNQALAYLDAHTQPGDPVAVMPEGTSLLFLSGRRNPLREEIVTPGFLDDAGEERAIQALDRSGTRIVLIVNRATREFGAEAFGRDYCRRLMRWIETRYTPCAMFGAQDPQLQVGDKPFFVRAYCRSS